MRIVFTSLGRVALSLAAVAFLTTAALFVVGSYMVTWPVLRLPPRERRVRAAMDLASAGMATMQAFARKAQSDTTESE